MAGSPPPGRVVAERQNRGCLASSASGNLVCWPPGATRSARAVRLFQLLVLLVDAPGADIEEGSRPADKIIRMPSVPSSPDTCPIDIDETAEAYVMGRLSPTETLHFEDHYLTCRHCTAAAEEAEWFVHAMKAATQRSRADPRDGPGHRA